MHLEPIRNLILLPSCSCASDFRSCAIRKLFNKWSYFVVSLTKERNRMPMLPNLPSHNAFLLEKSRKFLTENSTGFSSDLMENSRKLWIEDAQVRLRKISNFLKQCCNLGIRLCSYVRETAILVADLGRVFREWTSPVHNVRVCGIRNGFLHFKIRKAVIVFVTFSKRKVPWTLGVCKIRTLFLEKLWHEFF